MANTGYSKQFTTQMVVDLLGEGEMTLRQIYEGLGCSKSTAEGLVGQLETEGIIKKRNLRTEKNPLWMYSLRK